MVRNIKYCEDPIKKHKKKIKINLRKVTDSFAEICDGKLKKGSLICVNCWKIISKNPRILDEMTCSPLDDEGEFSQFEVESTDSKHSSLDEDQADILMSNILPLLNQTPVKKKSISKSQRKLKAKSKLVLASTYLKKNLEASYGCSLKETPLKSLSIEETFDNINMYKNMMQELKNAFIECNSHNKKLQILTISPYTLKDTAHFFNTTIHMVKKSRKLKIEHGILPEVPTMSKGKRITKEQEALVQQFYESDEVSRMCPGQKECLKVRNADGQKELRQKRLILGNLKELFQLYQTDQNNPKLGFSTFAKLRPPYCILAGSGGTHCVCVCTYHQNPKLQLAALGARDLTYKDLIDFSVCDAEREECMMLTCKDCPREEGVKSFLELLDAVENAPDEVFYKQWVTVDRCNMIDKMEPLDEFLTSLSKKISTMVRHHYIAKKQTQYFKDLKENIKPETEAVIVGDFSENYSFIVQDAAQGFHWENSQCTVHPFIVYFKTTPQDKLHYSFCFLSEVTHHNTVMVHTFISKLLCQLKRKLPNLEKIYYFSDGCAGQYKNRYNFINLCHHEEDFGLTCEWHFFATSHGKTACDGIGGTVKRATARASLQRTTTNQILTPEDMFHFCEQNLSKSITYFFITKTELEEADGKLKKRFAESQTIPGTQSYHRFVPINPEELMVYPISSGTGEKKSIKKVSGSLDQAICLKSKDVKLGQYIGCIYDKHVWYGIVEEYCEEFDDFIVNFLVAAGPSGANSYYFPSRKDSCAVPGHHILAIMSPPKLKGGSRLQYTFLQKELDECDKRARIYLAQL